MKVSVLMITYNHEKYITEAINGVLTQDIDFEMELIVANDCSEDATDSIIRDIIETHPKGHLVTYINHPKNLGMNANFIQAYKQCQGQYIALCEGDDYWTDSLKLQKQIYCLEHNNDFVLCCTNAQKVGDVKHNDGARLFNSESKIIGINDFLQNSNPIATCTAIFKADALTDFGFLKNYNFGDWAVWAHILATSQNKKAYFLKEVTAAYRIHDRGFFNSLNKIQKLKNKKSNFISFKRFFPDYTSQVDIVLSELNSKIIKLQIQKESKLKGFMTYLFTKSNLKFKTTIKLLIKS